MAGLHVHKPDGTEGTATAKLTYKEGRKKLTLMIHGCIVKNDANLMRFLGKHIKQSADMKKFDQNSTKYFFYACDPDFEEERNYLKVTVVCHRFSDPSKPKVCELNLSPGIFVKVQDQHIFLLCDSKSSDRDFNKSKNFVKDHSKNILVAQKLTKAIYGLSCEEEEEEDYPKFILLSTLNHQSSNVYHIDAKCHKTLQDTGPVLLQDKKTVVGSFEKQDNELISISIFGSNQDNKTEVYSSAGKSQEVESEQKPEARSHAERAAGGQNHDAKLEKELSDEEKNTENKKLSTSLEVVEGNQNPGPRLDINVSEEESNKEKKKNTPQPSSHSEDVADQIPDPTLNEESEDKKIEEDKMTQPQKAPLEKDVSQPDKGNDKQETSKQGQEHEYKFPDSLQDQTDAQQFNNCDLKCKPGQQVSNGSLNHGTTDSYEGNIQQQATKKDETFASHVQDQSKLAENEKTGKDILIVPVKSGPNSNDEEKPPIQETSGSFGGFDPIEEIKTTLPDGYQMHDDLGWKKNTERYRRFLLYVAQNATGKWQEVGERLDIKDNKLQSLKADYSIEGSAEQAYQMLVHWRQSDKNPTLKKLLDALIATELVEVVYKVSDMLIDSRSRGGIAVTAKLLNEITNDVRDVWKFLGRYLAIDESAIHSIKIENHGNRREQARQMFVKWKQSNASRATTGVLINALEDVGKSNVAKTVRASRLGT